ncbi:MAG TPA: hypothetical protein VNV86_08230 [Candidatus Acidoferrum sp.]|nr:hypothetical protein [Candidatus Acidoferrum sp.]
MSEALRELLRGLIDYAGLFPPASLDVPDAVRNYRAYRSGPHAWMLGRFVVPAARVAEIPADFPLNVIAPDKKSERAGDVEYIEIPVTADPAGMSARAKIRTGGLTAEAYPSAEDLAGFLHRAAGARVAFKATAGLHHPLPLPPMHGFVNVFLAACQVWHGATEADALATLRATSIDIDLTPEQVRDARTNFAISFGSCSFEEPVDDLRRLGWL